VKVVGKSEMHEIVCSIGEMGKKIKKNSKKKWQFRKNVRGTLP
jgi:hypothetical protein